MGTFCILFDNGRTFTRLDGTWATLDTAQSVADAFNRAHNCDRNFRPFIVSHPCAQRAERH